LVQSDRDDPSLPLVTAPFGHASQVYILHIIGKGPSLTDAYK